VICAATAGTGRCRILFFLFRFWGEYEDGNLICIEMKKKRNRAGLNADKQRLQDLVGSEYGYNYFAGYMILIGINQAPEKCGLWIESEYKRK